MAANSTPVAAIPDLTQINSPTGRSYEDADGNSYVSVTTALGILDKGGLVKWGAKLEKERTVDVAVTEYTRAHVLNSFPEPNQFRRRLNDSLPGFAYETVRDDAASLGTEVHAAVETLLKTGSVPQCSPAANLAVQAFQDWWAGQKLTALLSEQRLVSKKHGFAGTADLLLLSELDGDVIIADLKCTNSVGWSHGMQLSAYRLALFENGYKLANRGAIIQLPKTTTHRLQLHHYTGQELDEHFTAFTHCLALHAARDEQDPWRKRRGY